MKKLIDAAYGGRVFAAMVVAGLALFGFSISVLMLPPSEKIGERLAEFTCLQVAFTSERTVAIFESFPIDMLLAYRELLVPGDISFAWAYGLLLAGLVGLVARRLDGGWRRAGAIFAWLPLLASALDCVEDGFLFASVTGFIQDSSSTIPPLLPLLAGVAATAKYLALTVLTPLYCIGGVIKGLPAVFRGFSAGGQVLSGIGALLLFVFVLLNMYSMIARPLQQLPPCF